MPSQQVHLEKAAHNERFLRTFNISETPYTDWMVTVAFLTAVQYVDAYLATLGPSYERVPNHKTRNNLIILAKLPRDITDRYFHLKEDSENARYEAYQFTRDEVAQVLMDFLEPVRHHIQQALGIT